MVYLESEGYSCRWPRGFMVMKIVIQYAILFVYRYWWYKHLLYVERHKTATVPDNWSGGQVNYALSGAVCTDAWKTHDQGPSSHTVRQFSCCGHRYQMCERNVLIACWVIPPFKAPSTFVLWFCFHLSLSHSLNLPLISEFSSLFLNSQTRVLEYQS